MTRSRRFTTISFDGDATLWDFEKVMHHALAIALRELQRRVRSTASDALTISRMIAIRETVARELKGKTVHLEEIRLRAFERTLASVGCHDLSLARELNALYLKHRFEDIELYPDVIPALDELGARFRIGLLSNGNGYPERCGLAGRFRFVVFSQDVGVEKPHPDIFLDACRRGGCAPDELLHVGDSLESDIAGANGVGATSVWLNRDGSPNTTPIQPDHEIRSLANLGRILER